MCKPGTIEVTTGKFTIIKLTDGGDHDEQDIDELHQTLKDFLPTYDVSITPKVPAAAAEPGESEAEPEAEEAEAPAEGEAAEAEPEALDEAAAPEVGDEEAEPEAGEGEAAEAESEEE